MVEFNGQHMTLQAAERMIQHELGNLQRCIQTHAWMAAGVYANSIERMADALDAARAKLREG